MYQELVITLSVLSFGVLMYGLCSQRSPDNLDDEEKCSENKVKEAQVSSWQTNY
jgi:hypothetical protein